MVLEEQVAQGGCGCPIPGGIQGQAGWGSGQPGLLVGDPAHSRGLETRWSLWSFSTQAILWNPSEEMLSLEYIVCKTLSIKLVLFSQHWPHKTLKLTSLSSTGIVLLADVIHGWIFGFLLSDSSPLQPVNVTLWLRAVTLQEQSPAETIPESVRCV